MVDTRKLRDLAASYRTRGSKEGNDLVARYDLDMARYLDCIAATVEAAADAGRTERPRQEPEPQQEGSRNAQ